MGVILNFLPIQEGEGTPSPDNVMPIKPGYVLASKNIGNWLSPNEFIIRDKINDFRNWSNEVDVTGKIGTTYVYSAFLDNTDGTMDAAVRVWLKNSSGGYTRYVTGEPIHLGEAKRSWVVITVAEGEVELCCGLVFSNSGIAKEPMLEIGSEATGYEPVRDPIDIYGGYVDMDASEVVEEWAYTELNGNSDEEWTIYRPPTMDTYVFWIGISGKVVERFLSKCDRYENYRDVWGAAGLNRYGVFSDHATLSRWYFKPPYDGFEEDLSAWKEWLANNPLQLAYKLATPIHHTLTAAQLTQAYNKLVTISPAMLQNRRRIIAGQPHLASASGQFNATLSAPLKELKVGFQPVQADGVPSPDNVMPISGWTGVRVGHSGKNLLSLNVPYAPPSDTGTTATKKRIFTPNTYCPGVSYSNYYIPANVWSYEINENTVTVSSSAGYGLGFPIEIIGGKTYRVSATMTGKAGFINIAAYDAEGNFIGPANSTNYIYASYTAPQNAVTAVLIFRNQTSRNDPQTTTFTNVQIEPGEAVTTYGEYQPWEVAGVDWSEYGTIYGGYVDLVSGELVGEYEYFLLNSGDNIGSYTEYDDINSVVIGVARMPSKAKPSSTSTLRCNYFKSTTNRIEWGAFIGSTSNLLLYVPKSFTSGDFGAYLQENPIQVCYERETPVRYQLTPTQIKALKGINNIWSDANGDITVRYWTR